MLELALTHRSYSAENNERLEFLGDSILNFTIARELYALFPTASEGQLSRLRSGMVKQATLAGVAKELALGELLQMGGGEMKSGGFRRASILSDTLEAVIGGVLLDAGVEEAMACTLRLFESRLAGLNLADLKKDAKSELQEFLQGKGEPVPEYRLVSTRGKSPDQEFEIECRSNLLEQPVRATGTSKRRAEQTAATLMLEKLQVES